MRNRRLSAAREIASNLPESEERDHMGSPSFRVRGKIFVQLSEDESVVLVKLSLEEQEALLDSDPGRFRVPEYRSRYGWTYVRVSGTTYEQLRDLIVRGRGV